MTTTQATTPDELYLLAGLPVHQTTRDSILRGFHEEWLEDDLDLAGLNPFEAHHLAAFIENQSSTDERNRFAADWRLAHGLLTAAEYKERSK